jgi:hypothetical protein
MLLSAPAIADLLRLPVAQSEIVNLLDDSTIM